MIIRLKLIKLQTSRRRIGLWLLRSQFCGQTGDRQTTDAETQIPTETLSCNKGRLWGYKTIDIN